MLKRKILLLFLFFNLAKGVKLNFSDNIYNLYSYIDSFDIIKITNNSLLSNYKYPIESNGEVIYLKIRCEEVPKIKCKKGRPNIYAFLNSFYLIDSKGQVSYLKNYLLTAEEFKNSFYICITFTIDGGTLLNEKDNSKSYAYITIYQICK